MIKRIFSCLLLLGATILAPAADAIAQTLNVASYNIRLANSRDTRQGDGWEQRVDCLCDVIRFSDFDIFGAQEVRHEQLADMLARLPGYDYIGVGRDDGATAGEYSPVFYKKSRFRLLDSGTFWLSETPDRVSKGWDAVCMRVCSWGYFRDNVTHKRFWFFNLHMDHRGIEARRRSAQLIVDHIRKVCGTGANVVLTGDFNVSQRNEIYSTFADCGFLKDCYEAAAFRFAPSGTFNSFKPENWSADRIDHIWVSSAATVERYGILTYHYWSAKDNEEGDAHDAPKEIRMEQRRLRLPSDHYPVNVFVKF